MRIPVLLVEDTPSLQFVYRSVLTAAGMNVHPAGSASEALQLLHQVKPGVVILDLMLPDRDGLALMSEMLAINPDLCVVVMSAQGSVDRAVAAMRAGAFDFLLKPFEENRFLAAVRAAVLAAEETAPGQPAPKRRAETAASSDPAASIGSSEAMKQVHRVISSVAGSIATVFITGESGTGKELAAIALHTQSPRARGPFIALNCGAIPHDLLESEVFGHLKGSFTGAIADKPGAAMAADGGTLFLDEVCEMAPALQTKLLRFLQTSMVQPLGATRPQKVDVRIICATNQDPLDAVRRGQFREDLYYRLHVVPLHMPPLRDRGRDAAEIAEVALRRFGGEEGKSFAGVAPETQRILLRYRWPGNVRQLLNVMRNIAVLQPGGLVTPDMLPVEMLREDPGQHRGASPPDAPLGTAGGTTGSRAAGFAPVAARFDDAGPVFAGKTLAEIERMAIEAALARHQGSVPKAAHDLDISVSTLYRRIEAWKSGQS
ncbi:sigma-54 dependent transcriptional regulator [Pseudomonas sp. GX19020]|uniref:sigma-54-dependent transcriptional regulator n=1 Tax=Pseudomonas sp. GX19020 TaxID=2942277 RepID=UPI0020188A6F|nr:sigma-54 dependent transcriptional regulator [Pseudomonas sp. GX19020]MCL4067752.1 sigma-54 dependent transcriptional regulator [Pseudomonas sp. GX19020]